MRFEFWRGSTPSSSRRRPGSRQKRGAPYAHLPGLRPRRSDEGRHRIFPDSSGRRPGSRQEGRASRASARTPASPESLFARPIYEWPYAHGVGFKTPATASGPQPRSDVLSYASLTAVLVQEQPSIQVEIGGSHIHLYYADAAIFNITASV